MAIVAETEHIRSGANDNTPDVAAELAQLEAEEADIRGRIKAPEVPKSMWKRFAEKVADLWHRFVSWLKRLFGIKN
jgi:hypothetical protein